MQNSPKMERINNKKSTNKWIISEESLNKYENLQEIELDK